MVARVWRQVGLEPTRKAHRKLKTMQIVYKELVTAAGYLGIYIGQNTSDCTLKVGAFYCR